MKYLLDLHTHTVASGHAYSTLQELIAAAKKKDLKVLGFSDHAPTIPGGAHIYHFNNLKIIPNVLEGIRILKGVEANIIDYKGNIDICHEVASSLDYVIASLHPPCMAAGTIEENTAAIVGAISNPHVKIIGHPDDARFPLNYEKVVLAAKEHHTLLEMNATSINPKGFRLNAKENYNTILTLCKKNRVPIILGSDAHISYQVGDFDFCESLLADLDFPKDLIVNYSVEKLQGFIDFEME